MSVLLLAALLVGCRRPVPPTPAAVETPAEPLSDADLARWTKELVPLVEKHGGHMFREAPPVRFLTPEAFATVAREEAALVMERVYRQTPEPIRRARAEREGEVGLRGLFGKYGLFTGRVYVVRDNLLALRELHGAERGDAMARLVLAHELAHALQAEVHDPIPVLEGLVDQDHFHGWSAVSEGGANFVARQVARELGLEDAFWTLASTQGWGPEGLREPQAYDVWMRYGRGMSMLEEVVASEGMEGFWRWHAHPPADSAALFDIDAYAEHPSPPSVDFAALFEGVEQELTRGPWLVASSRLGPYVLRGEALRADRVDEADAVLAHLQEAHVLDLALPDRKADLRYLRFDTPGQARRYLDLLRSQQTEVARQTAARVGVTVLVDYAEVDGIEGDATLLRTERTPTGAGRFRESRTAWVVRGAEIVAVTATGFRPGLRLARTLNAMFTALDRSR